MGLRAKYELQETCRYGGSGFIYHLYGRAGFCNRWSCVYCGENIKCGGWEHLVQDHSQSDHQWCLHCPSPSFTIVSTSIACLNMFWYHRLAYDMLRVSAQAKTGPGPAELQIMRRSLEPHPTDHGWPASQETYRSNWQSGENGY